jgi:DNA-binding PadR family transcriptional regulator
VLVGRGGAGPHDLRRQAGTGRIFWEAAPSQFYAEPKRLAKLGYLVAEKRPGQTHERTHYTITDRGREALAAWVRTPVGLPRFQHETVVRLLAGDLVDRGAIREGLQSLRAELDDVQAGLDVSRSQWASLPHRADLLEVNDRYARRLVDLQREWLADAERVLGT